MRLRLTLVSLVVSFAPALAQSEALKYPAYYTGVRLYEACKAEAPDCTAYVMAVADTISVLETENSTPTICIPSGVSARQIILSFQGFVAKNPIMLSNPAADLVRGWTA